LPGVLHETSGLVFSDNLLWTTNDDTDTTVYGVDTSGIIKKGNGPEKVQQRLGGHFTGQQLFLYWRFWK
jgi:hypothetical protein